MKKTAAEAAETRQAILRAALAEFSQRGYSATTLEGVARAAGVTRGAVYWHFASKATLYEELLRTFGGQSGAIMGAAAAEGGDFIAICQRILTRLFIQLEEDKELRAVMDLSLFKTEHTEELAGMLANQRASMNELVAQLAGDHAGGHRPGRATSRSRSLGRGARVPGLPARRLPPLAVRPRRLLAARARVRAG